MALGRAEYLGLLLRRLLKRGEAQVASAVAKQILALRAGRPPRWDLNRLFQLLLDVEFAMDRRGISKGRACAEIAEREGVRVGQIERLHTKAKKHWGRQFSKHRAAYLADYEREHSDKTLPK